MKYAQLFTENALVMQDDKGNKETFAYVGAVADSNAIASLQTEVNGRGAVTAAALSLMVQILDHPRFDGYSGKVEIGAKMPKEFKAAIREQEEATLKPLFYAFYDAKHAKQAKLAEKDAKHEYHGAKAIAWDGFIGALREGGIYGNVKSYSMQYMGYFGKLPCVYDDGQPDKSKLLATSAMMKMIANAKTDLVPKADEGIAGELKALAQRLADRNEKTTLGATADALLALRAMLATFEGLQREESEAALATYEAKNVGHVTATYQDVLGKARKAPAKASTKGKAVEPALV